MAQIGQGKQRPVKHKDETVNKAGGVAFKITDPTQRLLHMCGTMVNEPTYYPDKEKDTEGLPARGLTSETETLIRTCEEVLKTENPDDLLVIARWTREELHFRTSPMVMLAVAAQFTGGLPSHAKGETPKPGMVSLYAPHIVKRADEPANLFRMWRYLYGNIQDVGGRQLSTQSIPNVLKRAISRAYKQFHETVLAKYAGTGGTPTVRDVIRACARDAIKVPKVLYMVDREAWLNGNPDAEGSKRFDPAKVTPFLYARHKLAQCTEFDEEAQRLAKGAQATWNDLTSQFGSDERVWKFAAGQMPYMAALKNLRNMHENGVDLEAAGILPLLRNEKKVRKSKQFPYRFLSAARVFDPSVGARVSRYTSRVKASTDTRVLKILDTLDQALGHSVANLETLPGTTAIFVDNSFSMDSQVSAKSAISHVDAGNMLAALVFTQSEDTAICAFTDKPYAVACRKADSVLTNMVRIGKAGGDGGSTNAHLCAPYLQKQNIKVDRIILISDMQCWNSYGYGSRNFRGSVQEYRKWVGKDVWLHSINIGGNTPQSQMAGDDTNVSLWSGFSGELINAIARVERGAETAKASAEVQDSTEVPGIEDLRKRYRVL